MGRITDQVWNTDAAEQRRLATSLASAHALVQSTVRERDKSAAGKAAWSAAATAMHRVWRDFYDEDQPDSRAEAVRAGDRAAIDKATDLWNVVRAPGRALSPLDQGPMPRAADAANLQ